jgi:amino acid transporter
VAVRKAAGLLGGGDNLPETFGYSVKRRLLGPPLVNEQLGEERLSIPLALGVLSPDGISSSAYGSEEILIELLRGGLAIAAFTVLIPLTGVVLFVLALVVLSYREVVTVYTRTGGSYVVARDNFGPRVAQIAAVALLIDYTVTVAVQTAAGAAAIVSAFPALTTVPVIGPQILRIISVIVILMLCYGNLRGIREAGRAFALPTYLFSGGVILMIVMGLIREAVGRLPVIDPAKLHGTWYQGSHGLSLTFSFLLVWTLLRAFANGGSSLTGIEAVSNAVSALKPPEGPNARKVLVTQGVILAFLVGGISWLAHVMHATPFVKGTPTVLSQEANLIFGGGGGQVLFYFVQGATALILFTGGNTSFNGFPFLASFVAQDAFLPRWLTKRGHRLVFSNGIIVLTIVSLALIIIVGANVNNLVPFYAIGVFTGFSIAGFGMSKYHLRHKEPGWRRRLVINFSAGVLTGFVVLIFAVTKFTEGAWLIVIVGPILVFTLVRLNREYRSEDQVLENIGDRRAAGIMPRQPNYTRRVVLVFVDSFDLATMAALRYARSLRPTSMRAVHFVIDSARAERLREQWVRYAQDVPLEMIDTADRRLLRAAQDLVRREAEQPGTQVTVVLPRRSFSPLIGRMLHDRTADKIAGVVSRIPNAAAVVIPFDVESRVRVLEERHAEQEAAAKRARDQVAVASGARGNLASVPAERPAETAERPAGTAERPPADAAERPVGTGDGRPVDATGTPAPTAPETPATSESPTRPETPVSSQTPGVTPIGSLRAPGRATVEGVVRSVETRPVEQNAVLVCKVADSTGELTALFYGRKQIPGLLVGSRIRLSGPVGMKDRRPVMVNPAYELLSLLVGPGGDQFVGGVDHDGVAVTETDRAAQANERPADDARDVGPAVEQGRQVTGGIRDLQGEHGVLLDRPDLQGPNPAFHGGLARGGERADRLDVRGRHWPAVGFHSFRRRRAVVAVPSLH